MKKELEFLENRKANEKVSFGKFSSDTTINAEICRAHRKNRKKFHLKTGKVSFEKFSSDTIKAEICRAHCILRIPAPHIVFCSTHTLS